MLLGLPFVQVSDFYLTDDLAVLLKLVIEALTISDRVVIGAVDERPPHRRARTLRNTSLHRGEETVVFLGADAEYGSARELSEVVDGDVVEDTTIRQLELGLILRVRAADRARLGEAGGRVPRRIFV